MVIAVAVAVAIAVAIVPIVLLQFGRYCRRFRGCAIAPDLPPAPPGLPPGRAIATATNTTTRVSTSTATATDVDPSEAHRYASALAIPFKEAERMLQEATSETAVEVLPRVFLGNAASSANLIGLQRAGTTHVVNATATLPNHFEGTLSYLRLPLNDSLDDDLTPHLERACRFMSEALEHGGSVLVHCQQGVSRSASVVLAFCVRECGMELDAAKEMVHRLRWIWPNEAFKQQLRQFEAHVLAVSGTITGVETAVPSAIAPSAALSKTAPPALALDRTLSGNSSVAEGSWSDDE